MVEHVEPPVKRWTRRDWIRTSAALGAGAAAGAAGGYSLERLLAAPTAGGGEVRDTIVYGPDVPAGSPPPWWAGLAGTPMRGTDFQEWQGAPGIWRGLFESDRYTARSGWPVLAIRVRRDDSVFQSPPNVVLPSGVSLFYDDPARDIRIVVLFDRCTHLCCTPGWHVAPVPSSARDYAATPAVQAFGQDPVWCRCHDAQFDPMVLVDDRYANGAAYVGARVVRGPATLSLPVVPLRTGSDVIIGELVDARWYRSYCQ